MAIQKHMLPILEYDEDPGAILMPNREEGYRFPEKAVFAFLGEEIEQFALRNQCEMIGTFITITKTYPVYQTDYHGETVCFCQAPLGSAAAVQFLDFLISCGVRKVISAGSCGALEPLEENAFLIPVEALRDEGASYHYLPPSRTIRLDEEGVRAIRQVFVSRGIPFEECKTWTTDGFFRETREMVQYRREEGCKVVEMECSALAACARFRKILFGQILFTADTLADAENYDARDWGSSALAAALDLCFAAVCEMKNDP